MQPIIIIGAPRSGTNMLRDVLCQLPSVGTWPCDEINYIWRHGNVKYPNDAFPSHLATDLVIKFINNEFLKISKKYNINHVVEKTCANSLRVGFVDRTLPNAKYIFIVRNGIDVVASAMKCWQAELNIPYLLKKARYVPFSDLFYYTFKYFSNRVYRIFSNEKRLAFWGPIWDDMGFVFQKYTLYEACAIQWQQCVDRAEKDFMLIEPNRLLRICYENFITKGELERICDFMGISITKEKSRQLMSTVSSKSIGKGYKNLNDEQMENIISLINNTLQRYGYR